MSIAKTRLNNISGILLTLSLCVTSLLLSACSRIQVHTQINPEANFEAYSSFQVLPNGGQTEPVKSYPNRMRTIQDSRFFDKVQNAITSEMLSKGFKQTSVRGQADVVISYQTMVQNKIQHVPPLIGTTKRGRHFVAKPGHKSWYKEGTFVIDLIDRKTDELIWRGVGVGMMRDMKPGAEMQTAVAEILEELPTRQSSSPKSTLTGQALDQ